MKKNEMRISSYIDDLNNEKTPKKYMNLEKKRGNQEEQEDNEEMEVLMNTVRIIKSLKEPAMPENGFEERLIKSIKTKKSFKKIWISGLVSAAAILILAFMFVKLPSILPNNVNIVYAIEKAYEQVEAYHGNLRIISVNGEGEESIQSELEIWSNQKGNYYVEVLSGWNQGHITVNNGDKKWQIRPEENKIYLYPSFPDAYGFTLELGNEVEEMAAAIEVKEIGIENIGEREAKKLEVVPDGGSPYYLWIDNETNLPLQRESAMSNGIQYRVTYTSIEYMDSIPKTMQILTIPEGYTTEETESWQIVNSLEEAENALGFLPNTFSQAPEGFYLKAIGINPDTKSTRLSYESGESSEEVVLLQKEKSSKWKTDPVAVIGKVNNNPAEIIENFHDNEGALLGSRAYGEAPDIMSIRWQEDQSEYTIISNLSLERIEELIESYLGKTVEFPLSEKTETMPEEENIPKEGNLPKIEEPVNLEIEENEQKSVDGGHSPWRLDPVYVAQVYASLKLSPEGITGDYPIAYEEIEIIQNDGEKAIAQIHSDVSDIDKVYLEKLIRKDATGIWTVVGYDPK